MKLQLFSGSSNVALAELISKQLDLQLGEIYLHMFPSGEHYCQYQENIRGNDVFLIQSICNPAHEKFMELLVMIDAARRASAGRITVVAPYMGYLRQDRKTKSRTPITAKLAANLLTEAGADRIVGLDFHCEQAQGFFDIPVDHLYAMPIFINYFKYWADYYKIAIVSPDAGGIKRANSFSKSLDADFAFIAKKRINDTEVEMQGLVGDVKDKTVIIIDDLTESCGTLCEAAKVCAQNGANAVWAAVTHGLLNGKAVERLEEETFLNGLIITDSVEGNFNSKKITKLSAAPLLSKAIGCIHDNKSVSELFEI